MRTRSTASHGNQRPFAPSRWRPRRSTYRYSLMTPRRQGSVHDGISCRPGCVRSSIGCRPLTRHAHTMQPPSRTGASCPLRHGLDPNTYRAIRRGRDRPPVTGTSVGLLRPVDARVGRRIDIAWLRHGGKVLCRMEWVADQDASDRASHGDPSPDTHTRCNHHRGQGHRAPCVMALIQTRTVPSDENAICHQLREPASVRSVQLAPASVDV
jgi:hypothetical protein